MHNWAENFRNVHTGKNRQNVHFRELDDLPLFIFTDAWYFQAIHSVTISLAVSAHNLTERQFCLEDKLLLHDSYVTFSVLKFSIQNSRAFLNLYI